jgi:hypothetical protein
VKGIVTAKLPDPRWGEPNIARVIPTEDGGPWGRLQFLVGTDWEPLFPVVPKLVLDQALRGHATPLMKVLGPPPKALVKRLPVAELPCSQRKSCVSHTPLCVPGPMVPDCWETPTFTGEEANLVSYVVRLWRDGVVIVVEEPE